MRIKNQCPPTHMGTTCRAALAPGEPEQMVLLQEVQTDEMLGMNVTSSSNFFLTTEEQRESRPPNPTPDTFGFSLQYPYLRKYWMALHLCKDKDP